MTDKQEFNAGDLVQLKSGGPVMTVERVGKTHRDEFNGSYGCSWFAGAKHNMESFAQAALIPADIKDDA